MIKKKFCPKCKGENISVKHTIKSGVLGDYCNDCGFGKDIYFAFPIKNNKVNKND